MPIELDVTHSEMFPYAIVLVRRLGASQIFIEADILMGGRKHRPDVLGVRDHGDSLKNLIIVECEAAHGRIFDDGGPVWRYAQNIELRKAAEFHFILRSQAKYREGRITEWFGSDAVTHDFDLMKDEKQIALTELLK